MGLYKLAVNVFVAFKFWIFFDFERIFAQKDECCFFFDVTFEIANKNKQQETPAGNFLNCCPEHFFFSIESTRKKMRVCFF